MSVMTGTCPKCGVTYCGWALVNPEFQKCDRCGCELEIFRDGFRVATTNSSGNTRDNRTASSK